MLCAVGGNNQRREKVTTVARLSTDATIFSFST
jgi:hypothetical protein